MTIGTVKWYSKENGYGIIMQNNGNKDIYVDKDDVVKAGLKYLSHGQSVSYAIGRSLTDREISQNLKSLHI